MGYKLYLYIKNKQRNGPKLFIMLIITWKSSSFFFQIHVVASKLADARKFPQGDQEIFLTVRWCPSDSTHLHCQLSPVCERTGHRTLIKYNWLHTHFRLEYQAEWLRVHVNASALILGVALPSLPHIRIARSPPQEASSAPVGLHATYQQRESGCALSLCTSCSVSFIWSLSWRGNLTGLKTALKIRNGFNDLIITTELHCLLLMSDVYQMFPTSCTLFLLLFRVSVVIYKPQRRLHRRLGSVC